MLFVSQRARVAHLGLPECSDRWARRSASQGGQLMMLMINYNNRDKRWGMQIMSYHLQLDRPFLNSPFYRIDLNAATVVLFVRLDGAQWRRRGSSRWPACVVSVVKNWTMESVLSSPMDRIMMIFLSIWPPMLSTGCKLNFDLCKMIT